LLMVEHKSNRVTQDLPKQPACQVPEVLGPHPLYGVAPRQLAENCVDPVVKAAQEGAPFGGRIELLVPVMSIGAALTSMFVTWRWVA